MLYNDTIDQGATFYREVTLYSDAAKTTAVDLTGKTIRGTLMTDKGQVCGSFSCAVIDDPKLGKMAWSMRRTSTSTLLPLTTYTHTVHLDYPDPDDAGQTRTDLAMYGSITVKMGPPL